MSCTDIWWFDSLVDTKIIVNVHGMVVARFEGFMCKLIITCFCPQDFALRFRNTWPFGASTIHCHLLFS